MRVFVAYSRPRGILGHIVFTVMVYYAHKTESIDIKVNRKDVTYSCSSCGKWATITTSTLEASQHRRSSILELFRYDNVEPGDTINLTLNDTDLLIYQFTKLKITHKSLSINTSVHKIRTNLSLGQLPGKIYEVIVIDWDAYLNECLDSGRELHVEEELIQKTMAAEQIKIKELLLAPVKQTSVFEGTQQFIEGELRYVE